MSVISRIQVISFIDNNYLYFDSYLSYNDKTEDGIMKAIGKGSIASFLAVLLNVGWYLATLGFGVVLFIVALVMLGATPRLEMTIPVTFTLDSTAHRVISPSLGIDEAHVQGS